MELCLMTDKPKIDERYRSAIGTGSQRDVIGAFGVADRRLTSGWVPTGPDGEGYAIQKAPLAVSLERLFAGDNAAALDIVETLAHMAWSKANNENAKPKITRPVAHDIAKAVLAWFRYGTCKTCGGHGWELIPGTRTHSERQCAPCEGAGKVNLDEEIDPEGKQPAKRELARWLIVEVMRESGRAGPEAMKALAPRLDL